MDLEHFGEATEAIEFDPMDIEELQVYERVPSRINTKEIDGECIQCDRYFKNLKQHCFTAHANQPVYTPTPNDLARSNLKKRKVRTETEPTSNENTQRLIKKRQIAPIIPATTMAFGQKKTIRQYSLPAETIIEPIVNITEINQLKIDNISPIIDLEVSTLFRMRGLFSN